MPDDTIVIKAPAGTKARWVRADEQARREIYSAWRNQATADRRSKEAQ